MRPIKKALAGALSLLLLAGTVVPGMQGLHARADGAPETVATWVATSDLMNQQTTSWAATGGTHAASAALTVNTSTVGGSMRFTSKGGIDISGWDDGAGTKCWQLALNTQHYKSLTLSFNAGTSTGGALNFAVRYSTDGTNFTNVDNSAYTVPTASLIKAPATVTFAGGSATLSLPDGAANQPNLILQFYMTDTSANGGGSISATTAEQIGNILVQGVPTGSDVDTLGLAADITAAQNLYNGTTVGTDAGDCTQSAKDALQSAIAAAAAVLNDGSATQTQVDTADNSFEAAVTAFKASLVTLDTVAGWSYTSTTNYLTPYSSNNPKQLDATDGVNKSGEELTDDRCTVGPTWVAGTIPGYVRDVAWNNNGSSTKYWQISCSTKNYQHLAISANVWSAGPEHFKVQYSLNGTDFADVDNSAFTLPYATTEAIPFASGATLALPDAAANQNTVTLRIIVTDNASNIPNDPGGMMSSSSSMEIDNIYVKGTLVAQPAVDKTALQSAITSAQGKYNAAVVGTAPGDYPQSAKDALNTAVTAANTVNNNAGATQTDVDGAVTALNTAVTAFSNAIVPAPTVDKSALQSAITSAQGKYNAAVVGTAPGDYPQSAKDALGTAISAANTVFNNAGATKTDVDSAVTALNTAVTTFSNAVVIPCQPVPQSPAPATTINDSTSPSASNPKTGDNGSYVPIAVTFAALFALVGTTAGGIVKKKHNHA